MISSSYHPPSGSQNSTPQRSSESSPGSLNNFNNMPTTEILSSATTRSAFLQSLQRSREREERRELDRENREREKDRDYRGFSADQQDSHQASYNSHNPNNYSPIMSRRRLSGASSGGASPSSPKLSPKPTSTPIKPISASTPVSQSKLASHAFTMSRSSTDDESKDCTAGGGYGDSGLRSSKSFNLEDFGTFSGSQNVIRKSDSYTLDSFDDSRKSKTFDADIRSKNDYREAVGSLALSADEFKRKYEENYRGTKSESSPLPLSNDLKGLIDSVVESHVAGLKNDLQSLHVEMIKQSLVQQNAFRSLLETYLPLTGKLMEALSETREENERLKMRIDELSRRRL